MSQEALLRIYKLFALWAEDFNFACQKGCSTCCTQSVSMTTLEGELIYDYIRTEKPEIMYMLDNLPASSYTSRTTNQFAAACLSEEVDEDIEEETWNLTPCIFLQDNCCTIYPVRSFMCRSLGSKIPCNKIGTAEMDPLFLTLNTIILQCIEHLDQGRPWGNMNSILALLRNSETEKTNETKNNLPVSKTIPGFLIPPDEKGKMLVQLQTLLKIIKLA